jgi:hypothetical protein
MNSANRHVQKNLVEAGEVVRRPSSGCSGIPFDPPLNNMFITVIDPVDLIPMSLFDVIEVLEERYFFSASRDEAFDRPERTVVQMRSVFRPLQNGFAAFMVVFAGKPHVLHALFGKETALIAYGSFT